MRDFRICIFLFTFLIYGAQHMVAQQTIKGRIVDATYGGGIPGSSVFISTTSAGTVSDSNGYFILNNIPKGKNDLIVSCIGFETAVFPFRQEQLPLELTVKMNSKAKVLEDVVLEPYETGDYNRWKFIFFPEFIGTGINAEQCKIINPQVLRFRYYTKSSRLVADADEPVIIENRALGYFIYYKLETFESNRDKRTTYFSGYPLFRELENDNKRKIERWQKNREEAYIGSVMHFMRCIQSNKLLEEGFEVRQMTKMVNEEKKRISKVYNPVITKKFASGSKHVSGFEYSKEPKGIPKDTLEYYRRIIVQPDTVMGYDQQLLTADSLVVANDGDNKIIFFDGPLFIKNKMQKVNGQPVYLWSSIALSAGKEISVGRNGNYYDSKDLVTSGSWAITERVCNMLPWDY
jgi:hypothetical protein